MGRIPASVSRRRTRGGESTLLTPSSTLAASRWQSSGASTSTVACAAACSAPSETTGCGKVSGRSNRAARSRANACHTQAVGAVALDGEVEHDVGREPGAQVVGERAPDLEVRVLARPEHQDPLVVLGQPELAARAQHPVRDHATQPPLLDLELPRQHGAHRGERNHVAGLEIPGAADDLDRFAPAGVDDDAADPVGLRDGGDLEHTGEHNLPQTLADPLHAFDDKTERVEVGCQGGNLRTISWPRLERGQLLQP